MFKSSKKYVICFFRPLLTMICNLVENKRIKHEYLFKYLLIVFMSTGFKFLISLGGINSVFFNPEKLIYSN